MKKGSILVLEDEIIVAIDLKEILEEDGYEIILAHSYDDGMSKLYAKKPQLAICDINLGNGPNGIDFATTAKFNFPDLEIIFATAFTKLSVLNQAQEINPINYIVKPWSEEQLKVSINIAFKFINEKKVQHAMLKDISLSEYKVLNLIGKQKKSKEIAALLFISEKTVRNHRYNIIKKLNLPNDNNSLLKWAISNLNK